MSEELDRAGADIRVEYKEAGLNCQIKKESQSREVRKEKRGMAKLDGEWIEIKYFVPSENDMANPKKRNGEYTAGYARFKNCGYLKYLDNGFVIFTDDIFKEIKKRADGLL